MKRHGMVERYPTLAQPWGASPFAGLFHRVASILHWRERLPRRPQQTTGDLPPLRQCMPTNAGQTFSGAY